MQYIYGLKDPFTNELKYIGKTCNQINDRLSSHLWSARNKGKKNLLYSWIKSLLNKDSRPIIYIIEECSDTVVNNREIYWIDYYKRNGFNLKNTQLGGDGNPKGYKFAKRYVPEKGKVPEHLKQYCGKSVHLMHSPIGREKRRLKRLGSKSPWLYKKIISRNIQTGVEIFFFSGRDAAKYFNITVNQISNRCRKKILTPIVNNMFRFLEDEYILPKSGQGYDKKVYIYQNSELILTFNTCTAAAKYFNINRKTLTYRCTHNKLFDNMQWSYNAY